jgi:spermidine synthase
VLLGQIPMLLHPDAKDVFDLGLGTGASAAAVARYPTVRSIEIVDIEPAGREAVKFFEPENRRVLSDPRVHYLAADGRNALLARKKSYDVIICDPSDIWVAGVANLFTREFYELAKSRLNPGGVFVQWWHTHALDPDHMKLVVATFRRVFPEASYWRPSVGDVIMVGTLLPLPWDFKRLTDRVTNTPGVADDLRGLGLWSPLSLFSAFVLSGKDLEDFVHGVNEDHVDDHPVVEYAAPRFLYVDTTSQNEAAVTSFQKSTFPQITGFDAARDLDAHGTYLLGFGYASLERRDTAIKLMEESTRLNPRNAKYLIGLANQYRGKGLDARAIGSYRRALEIERGEPEASMNLAAMLRAQGDDAAAEQLLRTAMEVSPQDTGPAIAAGRLLLDTNRPAEAIMLLSGAVLANRQQPALRLEFGQALLAAGRIGPGRPVGAQRCPACDAGGPRWRWRDRRPPRAANRTSWSRQPGDTAVLAEIAQLRQTSTGPVLRALTSVGFGEGSASSGC